MGFDPGYFLSAFPRLLGFLPTTLYLAVASMLIGAVIGLILAIVRVNGIPVLDQLAKLYISFFRGIPSLVQLFLIYFGLPSIFPAMSALDATAAAIIGLSLKQGAYLAEIFRAGLVSVDRGQYEAGLATGMGAATIYRRYILPQAAFNALPATGNIFIGLIKETSVAFTLGITELFASAQMLSAESFRYFETYLAVGVIYWVVVVVISWLLSLIERRMARPYLR